MNPGTSKSQREIFAMSALFYGAFGIGYGIDLVFQWFVVKVFGAELLGRYVFVEGLFLLTAAFTVFGIPTTIIKFLPQFRAKDDRAALSNLLGFSFWVPLILSAIIFTAVEVVLHFDLIKHSDQNLLTFIRIAAFALPGYSIATIFASMLNVTGNRKESIVIRSLLIKAPLLIYTVAIYFLFHSQKTVIYAFVMAHSTAMIYALILSLKVIKNKLKLPRRSLLTLTRRPDGRLLRFSSTMILLMVIGVVMAKTDKLMIGMMGHIDELGIYNVCFLIGSVINILLRGVTGIFSPILSEHYARREMDEISLLYTTSTKILINFSLPFVLTFIFFAKPVLGIYGPEFSTAWMVLVIIAMGQFVNILVGPVGNILAICDRERLLFITDSSMVVMNIGLNFYLIPRYGILGAAMATAVSIASINIIRLLLILFQLKIRIVRVRWWKQFLLLGILIGLVVTLSRVQSLWMVALTIILLLGTVLASYFFKPDAHDDYFADFFRSLLGRFGLMKKA